MCSAPAFCAWRRLPLICLKLLIGVCVRDGLAASVCVYRTSAAFVGPLPRGSRAVAVPLWLQVLSCSTWLIVRCLLLHQLFLLCFEFIGANSNSMNSITRAASSLLRSLFIEALLMLPKLCHLDNDLVIIIIQYIYCSTHYLHTYKTLPGGIFFLTVP